MKKSKSNIVKTLLLSVLLLLLLLWPLTCLAAEAIGIYNNGNGTGDVGTKLQQAIGKQQTINDGIRDSQATVENIGTSIDRSQTAERIAAEAVDRAASLVEESGLSLIHI